MWVETVIWSRLWLKTFVCFPRRRCGHGTSRKGIRTENYQHHDINAKLLYCGFCRNLFLRWPVIIIFYLFQQAEIIIATYPTPTHRVSSGLL